MDINIKKHAIRNTRVLSRARVSVYNDIYAE